MIGAFTIKDATSGGADDMVTGSDAKSTQTVPTSEGVNPAFTRVDGAGTGVR